MKNPEKPPISHIRPVNFEVLEGEEGDPHGRHATYRELTQDELDRAARHLRELLGAKGTWNAATQRWEWV